MYIHQQRVKGKVPRTSYSWALESYQMFPGSLFQINQIYWVMSYSMYFKTFRWNFEIHPVRQ